MASRIQLDRPERGTYVLVLKLNRPSVANVGSLGRIRLSRGYYTYVGSARKGMRSRLSRHLAREKRKRWHIDWLTTHPDVVPIAVATTGRTGLECEIAGLLSARTEALVRGFGCSDCECESHLFAMAHDPLQSPEFQKLLQHFRMDCYQPAVSSYSTLQSR
jgi:sugar fermentation stimulation protein A